MNKFYDVEKEKFRANAKQAFKELLKEKVFIL